MARKIFVNRTAKSKAAALVTGAGTTQHADTEDFTYGDKELIQLFITDDAGAIDAISGAANVTPLVSLGNPSWVPTGGTFTLTFGADTTSALAYNITAAALQTALEGLASIGAGNVRVSKGGYAYQVEFIGTLALADQSLLSAASAGNLLTPASSITISETRVGSDSVNELQTIQLFRLPIAIQGTWGAITEPHPGWEAILDCGTFRALQELDGAVKLELDSQDLQIVYLMVQTFDASSQPATHCIQPVTFWNSSSNTTLSVLGVTVITEFGFDLAMLDARYLLAGPVPNSAGKTVVFTSDFNGRTRELGVNSDGKPRDIIT